jgi:hypothetical protein
MRPAIPPSLFLMRFFSSLSETFSLSAAAALSGPSMDSNTPISASAIILSIPSGSSMFELEVLAYLEANPKFASIPTI